MVDCVEVTGMCWSRNDFLVWYFRISDIELGLIAAILEFLLSFRLGGLSCFLCLIEDSFI